MKSHQRGLLAGPKFNGRHTTIIEAAIPIIKQAKKLDSVTKIVVSEIKKAGQGPTLLRFTHVPAGLKLMVRGQQAVQEFYLYTKVPHLVEQDLVQ
jgi:hypothetical protein